MVRLLAEGWSVVATDACADDAALGYPLATRAELDAVAAAGDGHCVAAVADVRSQADLDAAVDLALARFGALDAAVAAAGVLAGGAPAWATSEEQWAVQLDVNLTGVWRLANAAVPALLDRPGPRPGHAAFVAISSAAGVRGLPQLAAYSASKHGVVGLVTSMAAELGPFDVTANVICPGSTRTPILEASAAGVRPGLERGVRPAPPAAPAPRARRDRGRGGVPVRPGRLGHHRRGAPRRCGHGRHVTDVGAAHPAPTSPGWPGPCTLDPSTRLLDGGRIVVGGSPLRILRLTDRGARLVLDLTAPEPRRRPAPRHRAGVAAAPARRGDPPPAPAAPVAR